MCFNHQQLPICVCIVTSWKPLTARNWWQVVCIIGEVRDRSVQFIYMYIWRQCSFTQCICVAFCNDLISPFSYCTTVRISPSVLYFIIFFFHFNCAISSFNWRSFLRLDLIFSGLLQSRRALPRERIITVQIVECDTIVLVNLW